MLSFPVWLAAATAATVEVHTTVPIDVALDGRITSRAFGPSTIRLPDISAGEHELTIYRGGQPQAVSLALEADEVLNVYVSADDISTDAPAPDLDALPPTVELISMDGARFQVQIGDRSLVLEPDTPLQLDGLEPGTYPLVVRRGDGLVVWVRGNLTLQDGDTIRLQLAEGRMVEVFGRPAAWRSGH